MPTFTERKRQVLHEMMTLRSAQPEVMDSFGAMHRAAVSDGALSFKTKELIALALGVHARCDGCIAVHVAAALNAGASREEIADALGVAILMGGAPASVYAGEALAATEEMLASNGDDPA